MNKQENWSLLWCTPEMYENFNFDIQFVSMLTNRIPITSPAQISITKWELSIIFFSGSLNILWDRFNDYLNALTLRWIELNWIELTTPKNRNNMTIIWARLKGSNGIDKMLAAFFEYLKFFCAKKRNHKRKTLVSFSRNVVGLLNSKGKNENEWRKWPINFGWLKYFSETLSPVFFQKRPPSVKRFCSLFCSILIWMFR